MGTMPDAAVWHLILRDTSDRRITFREGANIMKAKMKRWIGKLALIILCVIVILLILRFLGGILRWILSLLILVVLVYVILRLIQAIRK